MQKFIISVVSMGILFLISCSDELTSERQSGFNSSPVKNVDVSFNPSIRSVGKILLPNNYERLVVPPASFGDWIRKFPLKKNNTVYLYNKLPKSNQSLHYAVLDISTGDKDLQQCADALMRLRAEYLFSKNAFDQINFVTGNGTRFSFTEFALGERYALRGRRLQKYYSSNDLSCNTHPCLIKFLNTVFNYCSTYSLAIQSNPVKSMDEIQPGDMLVKAGSPGHAMMVGDVAVNIKNGKKIFLLIQSFMPAQDMHIVKNLAHPAFGPWYEINNGDALIATPGYTFYTNQLRRWKPQP